MAANWKSRMNAEIIKQNIQSMFDNPYDKPTDIIGFGSGGKEIACALLGLISEKEICFFDETIKSDPVFHYLDFSNMLAKSEIMIFTVELPEKYYANLNTLNEKCRIFIPSNFEKTLLAIKNAHKDESVVIVCPRQTTRGDEKDLRTASPS